MKNAADAGAKFVADMERGAQPYWLTFSGLQGVGKTMLAQQIFEESKKCNPGDYRNNPVWVSGSGVHDEDNRRPNCVWFHTSTIAQRMRDGEYDLPEFYRADYLVAIDDLGAARDKTDFLADGLYRIADQRAHKWMIWTTNLTLREISERLDPRISSRLIRDENRLVTITAGDYALRRK